jgi:Domain of unknown function (DUF4265)
MKSIEHIKVLFEHDAFDSKTYESAWVKLENGRYLLDNILFYAKEYSLGDEILVREHNGEFFASGISSESGHSLVRILIADQEKVESIRKSLKLMGCTSELSNFDRLISVDIPKSVIFSSIIDWLETGEESGDWEYEEACISSLHKLQ